MLGMLNPQALWNSQGYIRLEHELLYSLQNVLFLLPEIGILEIFGRPSNQVAC